MTDEQRSGRPSTSTYLVPEIENTVRANRQMLLKDLEEQFYLSRGTIWDIVHERLGYRKVYSRLVPRQLTEVKINQSRYRPGWAQRVPGN